MYKSLIKETCKDFKMLRLIFVRQPKKLLMGEYTADVKWQTCTKGTKRDYESIHFISLFNFIIPGTRNQV